MKYFFCLKKKKLSNKDPELTFFFIGQLQVIPIAHWLSKHYWFDIKCTKMEEVCTELKVVLYWISVFQMRSGIFTLIPH